MDSEKSRNSFHMKEKIDYRIIHLKMYFFNSFLPHSVIIIMQNKYPLYL